MLIIRHKNSKKVAASLIIKMAREMRQAAKSTRSRADARHLVDLLRIAGRF